MTCGTVTLRGKTTSQDFDMFDYAVTAKGENKGVKFSSLPHLCQATCTLVTLYFKTIGHNHLLCTHLLVASTLKYLNTLCSSLASKTSIIRLQRRHPCSLLRNQVQSNKAAVKLKHGIREKAQGGGNKRNAELIKPLFLSNASRLLQLICEE